MGRSPCCDKANVRRGPWSPEEDTALKNYVERYGTSGSWIALPRKAGLKRCGKSCRLRWLNYLRPDIKHGSFTEEEGNIICTLYNSLGSRWSVIASHLPGRTDNDVKNYWNTKLKKKLLAGKNGLTNTINNDVYISNKATPALTKAESDMHGFSDSLNTSFTTVPWSNEVQLLGQNLHPNTVVSDSDNFYPEFRRSTNNSYSGASSSQQVSSCLPVASSFSLAKDGDGEDDGFFSDLGFGSPYDVLNGFGL